MDLEPVRVVGFDFNPPPVVARVREWTRPGVGERQLAQADRFLPPETPAQGVGRRIDGDAAYMVMKQVSQRKSSSLKASS